MLTSCFDLLKKGTTDWRYIRYNNLISVVSFICVWKPHVTTCVSISSPKQISLLRFLQCIRKSLCVCWPPFFFFLFYWLYFSHFCDEGFHFESIFQMVQLPFHLGQYQIIIHLHQLRQILALFCWLVLVILNQNFAKGLKVTKIIKKINF